MNKQSEERHRVVLGVRMSIEETKAQQWFFNAALLRVQATAIRKRGGPESEASLLEAKARNSEAIAKGTMQRGAVE
jgi:hypothetical protein